MSGSHRHILIAEGGGMRGVFCTGILDRFLEIGFDPFDLYMGVSSGAGNLAAFMAKMPERNLKIFAGYSLSPRFISFKRFLKGGHYMDLDWLWDKTIADIRLDLSTIYQSGRPLVVCLTDVKSGKAVYKHTAPRNLEAVLKASSALPVIYRKFPAIDGRPCTDGGIADPIPVKEAIRLGARHIMVIRSRPRSYRKKESITQVLLQLKLWQYPALARAVALRVRRYNSRVRLIQNPPRNVSVLEVCPPQNLETHRFSRNRSDLIRGYLAGKNAADQAVENWHQEVPPL